MDWKKEAIRKLQDYDARREALRCVPLERQRIRCIREGLRSPKIDGDPVSGSTNRREDRLLGCVVKLQELDSTEKQNQLWVDMVGAALGTLDGEDKLILDRLFICPMKGSIERLCEELGMERATVYRRRDGALRRFTLAMYGLVES